MEECNKAIPNGPFIAKGEDIPWVPVNVFNAPYVIDLVHIDALQEYIHTGAHTHTVHTGARTVLFRSKQCLTG